MNKHPLSDLADDIRDHIERETQDNIERGMSPEEARYAALRKFGNVTLTREATRSVWIPMWLDQLRQDIWYSLRTLRRAPGFAAVAILSLTLGIGANALIFTFVKAVIWPSLPVRNPSDVVLIYSTTTNRNGEVIPYQSTSYLNAKDYRERNDVCSGLSIVIDSKARLNDQSAQVMVQMVTTEYFDVLGVAPPLGRGFTADDDRTMGAGAVAVLSHALWVERFGANRSIVGASIRLNQHVYTVIGVAPATLRNVGALRSPDLWIPMAMHDAILTGSEKEWFTLRAARLATMVGRLKSGVTPSIAQASLRVLGLELEREFPTDNAGRNVIVASLNQTVVPPRQRPMYVLSGMLFSAIAAFVLLIACSHVTNLLLARALHRRREIAIRFSLGASRARLVRQLLTESFLLAVVASGCGLFVAYGGREGLLTVLPAGLRHELTFTFDARLWVYTAGLAILVTLLGGLAPAFQASSSLRAGSMPDGDERPASQRLRIFSLRGSLVMAQVALSLCALIMATLFIRSLKEAQDVDIGFDVGHELVASIDLGAYQYTQARGEAFYRGLIDRLRHLSMISNASVADTPPVSGSFRRTTFIDGVDRSDPLNGQLNGVVSVTPGFFATAGIRILRGRDFDEHDDGRNEMVAIANKEAADRMWPGQNPIGKRLHFLLQTWEVTVIGVVDTVLYQNLGEPPQPIVYFPFHQHYSPQMTVYVRTTGDPIQAVSELRAVIRSLDSNIEPTGFRAGEQIIEDLLTPRRLGAQLLSAFGVLAWLLVGLGTFGVVSYGVSQRRREIAIRLALGAHASSVLKTIVGDGLVLALGGVVVGLVAAFSFTRLFANLLYGIPPTDPVSFAIGSIWVVMSIVLASYIPARKALQLDPLPALRHN